MASWMKYLAELRALQWGETKADLALKQLDAKMGARRSIAVKAQHLEPENQMSHVSKWGRKDLGHLILNGQDRHVGYRWHQW